MADENNEVQVAVLARDLDNLKTTVNRIDTETQRISLAVQDTRTTLLQAIQSGDTALLIAINNMNVRLSESDSKTLMYFTSRIDKLFYFTIAAFAALLGVMAHGFKWI